MTEKLFWSNPYQREFTATLIEQFPVLNGHAVILNQTCFYATSGGQPNDLGTLNSIPVTDVRYEGDRLIHLVSSPLREDSVVGLLDWKRRYDHMQQHTGQHILSAAFFKLFEAQTSSFHLGQDYCSIELDRTNLRDTHIQEAEDTANDVLLAATQVTTFFVDPDRAKDYNLRKQSDLAESLRIIRIGEFDLSPCSGTHVKNAAEIGTILVTGFERLSHTTKITFLCGDRVRAHYHRDLQILRTLSKTLTTSVDLLPSSVAKLQAQVKELRKEVSQLKEEGLEAEASEIANRARNWNDNHLVVAVWNRPYQEIRFLAQKLTEYPGTVGALASSQEKRVIFFKDRDLSLDLRTIFQEFLSRTSGKGGGPAHFMEAGGFQCEELESLLIDLFLRGPSA